MSSIKWRVSALTFAIVLIACSKTDQAPLVGCYSETGNNSKWYVQISYDGTFYAITTYDEDKKARDSLAEKNLQYKLFEGRQAIEKEAIASKDQSPSAEDLAQVKEFASRVERLIMPLTGKGWKFFELTDEQAKESGSKYMLSSFGPIPLQKIPCPAP